MVGAMVKRFALAAMFYTGFAFADPCGAPLLNTCINSDTHWPVPGTSTFPNIGGTTTALPGQVGFGLAATYLSQPIVLQIASPGPPGSKQPVVDDQFNLNFLWNIGITKRLEAGAAFPVTLGQGGTGLSPISGAPGSLKPTALRDFRFGVAYAILTPAKTAMDGRASDLAFSLTARMFMSAPTAEGGGFAGDRGAVFLPSIAGQLDLGRFVFASDVGLRLRGTTDFAGARIGSQLSVALGAGYHIVDDGLLTAIAEVRALPGFVSQSTLRQTANGFVRELNDKVGAPAEWNVGARSAPMFGGDLSFQLTGGGGIPLVEDGSATTPRFRFSLGIRYAPLNRDTDGDGITDKLDLCPKEAPGPIYPDAPKDGCPHPELAPRAVEFQGTFAPPTPPPPVQQPTQGMPTVP
jgi:OmpA-OmpF porin, OOP family